MISKLPNWVWAGAWVLALNAGTVNAIGLMSFEHQAVTHLTGSTSLLGIAIASLDVKSILHFVAILGSFLGGTVLSGLIIQDGALHLGRRYGIALILESVLLCAAVPLLAHQHASGLYCAAGACGLQNAMMTTYSGTVIRTTHISGMFTDLGIFLGHALRGQAVDLKRVRMSFLIISGFLSGGVIGALAYQKMESAALFLSVGITVSMAVAYGIYQIRKSR